MAWRSILLHCLVTGHVISATVGHRILAFRLWAGYLVNQIASGPRVWCVCKRETEQVDCVGFCRFFWIVELKHFSNLFTDLWVLFMTNQIAWSQFVWMERKRETSKTFTRDLKKSVVQRHTSIFWGAMLFFETSPDLRPSGHWIYAIGGAVGRSTGRLGEYCVRIGSTSKWLPLLILWPMVLAILHTSIDKSLFFHTYTFDARFCQCQEVYEPGKQADRCN